MTARSGVDLRGALPSDAAECALLLGQLGYVLDSRQAAERLERAARDPAGTVLVATGADGSVIGLIAVAWSAMLHHERPVGRITTLVVDDRARRLGIGRMLIKAGAQAARAAGCDVLELTSGMRRTEAHAFYQSIGFAHVGLRFTRSLRKKT